MSFENQKSDEKLLTEREVILVGALGEQKRRSRARWGNLLVIYMRVVAAIWLLFGLSYWARILVPGPGALETLPFNAAGGVIFLAVADVLAAAGLWMAAPWGGVIWLATVAAEMALIVAMPSHFAGGTPALSVLAGLALSYFLLTYYAANERID